MSAVPHEESAVEVARLTAAFAEGSTEEREAAYAAIESVVRGVDKAQAVAVAMACVRPLIGDVLCAPASEVGRAEYTRAAVVLSEMCTVDMVAVCAEGMRKDEAGEMPMLSMCVAPDTVFAEMVAKEPSEWTRDDALVAASQMAPWVSFTAAGVSAVCKMADGDEMEMMGRFAGPGGMPWIGENAQPPDRYLPLALLLLDLLRSESDMHSEVVIAGAWFTCHWIVLGKPPNGKALWEAGFLEVFNDAMQHYNPMERISKSNLVPSAIFCALKDVVQGAQMEGVEVIQLLLDASALDVAISSLISYQLLGKPEEASVAGVCWGVLSMLETLLDSPQARQIVTGKLRSAGVDSFRYMLDHPLFILDTGWDTGVHATRIAALVWGRDDDGGGLTFNQRDIDKMVQMADHHGQYAEIALSLGLPTDFGQTILNLCVSDINKQLLLNSEGFIPLLMDSLLLDPKHPRRVQPESDAVAPLVQRDFAEAIAQLAMFPRGREALLCDATVAEALQQVAVEGWTEEARLSATSALLAMSDSDKSPEVGRAQHDQDQKHIMLSYQWNVQDVVRRIVKELQFRSYQTWFGAHNMNLSCSLRAVQANEHFATALVALQCVCLFSGLVSTLDLENMKGSTVDAMSDAVDNAEVMLSCISLAYKESANCRLELQYGHEQDVDMIPLMMEEGYKATGWLGLIMGSRVYFNFHPAAVESDAAFVKQVDAVERELGGRGKPRARCASRVSEGIPPTMDGPAPAPAPAPASAPDPDPARTAAAVLASENSSSIMPNMQLSSPVKQQSIDDTSLVLRILEREDKLRQELQQQMEKMREEMKPAPPTEAISEQRLVALQVRLEALHAAKLLGDDEVCALEDMVADFVELASNGVVTLDVVRANDNACKLMKLVVLSERIVADAMFARQTRRKYL